MYCFTHAVKQTSILIVKQRYANNITFYKHLVLRLGADKHLIMSFPDPFLHYELAIKAMESRLHSVVGGDGAIYAIRSKLWEPLQQRDINDFELKAVIRVLLAR